MLGSAAVGALAAGAFAVGTSAGTHDRPSRPQPGRELQLGAYCRHLYGERSDAYQPHDVEAWRCSAWRNGVWGLEELDVADACRWQAGPTARLESTGDHDGVGGKTGGSATTETRLTCTL